MAHNRIAAGKLRHLVTIEAFVKTSTGDRGQPVGNWTTKGTAMTDIVPLRGEQVQIAHQLVARASHWVYLRYQGWGITAGMRVNFGGRYFAIGWVDEGDLRHHNMRLLVTEQTTGASPA